MERDDGKDASVLQDVEHAVQCGVQDIHLSVHRDTERLEGLPGGMFRAARFGGDGFLHQFRQLQRRLKRSVLPGLHDGGRDAGRVLFFSIGIEDLPKLGLRQVVAEVRCGRSFLTHPHVERRVRVEGESPFRCIQLMRADTEVRKDAVHTIDTEFRQSFGDVREVVMDDGDTGVRTNAFLNNLYCIRVLIHADESPLFGKLLEDLRRMAGAAGGGIDIDAVGFDLQ